MADPVSWLQIGQGWSVVAADGSAVGTVAQVEGNKEQDIFDGLAVDPGGGRSAALVYVPGEQVGVILPGEVTLKVAGPFDPFVPAPPETEWKPEKPSLGARISRWMRGG
jgi:hypothetical protein